MIKAEFEGIPLNKGELPLDLFNGQFVYKYGAYWSPDTWQAWVASIRTTEVFDLYPTGLYFSKPFYEVTSGTKLILLRLAAFAGFNASHDDDDPYQMHITHYNAGTDDIAAVYRYNYGLLANNIMRYSTANATVFLEVFRQQLNKPGGCLTRHLRRGLLESGAEQD